MSDYTQITNFTAKDGLASGDPEKIILGSDVDAELAALATAIASKFDSTDIASNAQAAALTSDTVLITPAKLAHALANNTTATLSLALGSVGSPSLFFTGDSNTGIFGTGSGQVRIAGDGVLGLIVDGGHIYLQDGLVGTPGAAFASDTDTGLYRIGTNTVGFAAGGAIAGRFDTSQWQYLDGAVGAPSISFISDTDTGIYRIGANNFAMVANGAIKFQVATNIVESDVVHYFVDGSAAAPAMSFATDTDTGIYRIAANRLGLTAGGSVVADFSSGVHASFTTPLLIATGIHNGTAPTGSASQFIASGTYTPTVSGTTNLDANTPRLCQWIRVGNVVTVSGGINYDPTSAGVETVFELSLPVASNFAQTYELAGFAAHDTQNNAHGVGYVKASVANNTAEVHQWTQGIVAVEARFTFTYLVL